VRLRTEVSGTPLADGPERAAGTLLDVESAREVYAPELPGLHTQGDSLDEAVENAREALVVYVDGLR
jgi:HicB_like antitoxin of bacterial toxin-antitoxin system